jgi:hypothetical protein
MKTAIITPHYHEYLKYVEENMFEDFNPVFVKDEIDVIGNVFKECVILPDASLMPKIQTTVMAVMIRLKR